MKCSFCGRSAAEVQKLVAGPRKLFGRIFICDRCAAQTIEIMERHPNEGSSHPGAKEKKSFLWRFFMTNRTSLAQN